MLMTQKFTKVCNFANFWSFCNILFYFKYADAFSLGVKNTPWWAWRGQVN